MTLINDNLLNAILSLDELESYAQENEEPSKYFKDEVQKYLQENNDPGVQMAIREEQVESEGDSGS